MHEFLGEINNILSHYNAMSVGECPNTPDIARVSTNCLILRASRLGNELVDDSRRLSHFLSGGQRSLALC